MELENKKCHICYFESIFAIVNIARKLNKDQQKLFTNNINSESSINIAVA